MVTFHANVTDSDFHQFSIDSNITGVVYQIENYSLHGAIEGFVIAGRHSVHHHIYLLNK